MVQHGRPHEHGWVAGNLRQPQRGSRIWRPPEMRLKSQASARWMQLSRWWPVVPWRWNDSEENLFQLTWIATTNIRICRSREARASQAPSMVSAVSLELLHEIGYPSVEDALACPDEGLPDGAEEMGLAGAGIADGDEIGAGLDPVAGGRPVPRSWLAACRTGP